MIYLLRNIGFTIVTLSLAVSSAYAQGFGGIRGTVLDDTGKPVPGATVSYTRTPEAVRDSKGRTHIGKPLVASQAVAAADGSFQAVDLPAGYYYLCAIGIDAHHVSSCLSGKPSPPVVVTANQTTTATLTILTGRLVTIHVVDPQGRISGGRRIPVGTITASGYYRPAISVSRGNGQYDYKVAIPQYEDTSLFLETAALRISGPLINATSPSQQQIHISNKDSGDVEVSLTVN